MNFPSQSDPLDFQVEKIVVDGLQPQSILDPRLTDFYSGLMHKQMTPGDLYQFSLNPSSNIQS